MGGGEEQAEFWSVKRQMSNAKCQNSNYKFQILMFSDSKGPSKGI